MVIARALATWCAEFDAAAIPQALRADACWRMLDSVGLVAAGASTEAGRAILADARDAHGAGEASLVGSVRRVPAAAAALAHGTLAHCRDFDDTFMDSVVHPGSVVVPTALALAESTGASIDAFHAAIVVGYEVAARLGAVAGRRFHAHHLHATGVIGPFAAAATAGRLLRLDAGQTTSAFGLAASMAGGLMAFVADGGWSKWLHAGWAAQGGIRAAQLARRGFRGPAHVLDGSHDLYAALVYGEPVERGTILAGLGTVWRAGDAQFKYYPCAHVIQPYIDAVLEIVREHHLTPGDIASIECTIAGWAAAIVCEPRAAKLAYASELEAIASLPYQLAFAVAERRVDLGALTDASRARSDLRALAARVTHVVDPALGQDFDGSIAVRTHAGARHARTASAAPPDRQKLREKFMNNIGPRGSDHAARLAAAGDWRDALSVLREVAA